MFVSLYESVPLLDAIEERVIVAGHALHPSAHVDLALGALENLLERRADEQPLAALADGVAEPLQQFAVSAAADVQLEAVEEADELGRAQQIRAGADVGPQHAHAPAVHSQRRDTRRDSAAKNGRGSSSAPTQRGQRDRSRPLGPKLQSWSSSACGFD